MTVDDPYGTYVFLRRVLQNFLRWEQKRGIWCLGVTEKSNRCLPGNWVEVKMWKRRWRDRLGGWNRLDEGSARIFWHWGKLTLVVLAYLSRPLISGHVTISNTNPGRIENNFLRLPPEGRASGARRVYSATQSLKSFYRSICFWYLKKKEGNTPIERNLSFPRQKKKRECLTFFEEEEGVGVHEAVENFFPSDVIPLYIYRLEDYSAHVWIVIFLSKTVIFIRIVFFNDGMMSWSYDSLRELMIFCYFTFRFHLSPNFPNALATVRFINLKVLRPERGNTVIFDASPKSVMLLLLFFFFSSSTFHRCRFPFSSKGTERWPNRLQDINYLGRKEEVGGREETEL